MECDCSAAELSVIPEGDERTTASRHSRASRQSRASRVSSNASIFSFWSGRCRHDNRIAPGNLEEFRSRSRGSIGSRSRRSRGSRGSRGSRHSTGSSSTKSKQDCEAQMVVPAEWIISADVRKVADDSISDERCSTRQIFIALIVGIVVLTSTIVTALMMNRNLHMQKDESMNGFLLEEKILMLRPKLEPMLFNSSIFHVKTSAQFKALEWLATEDLAVINEWGPKRLERRFSLATFYYSTGGELWEDKLNFLSYDHECQWSSAVTENGVKCDENGNPISLSIDDKKLRGSFPMEISHLSTLEELHLSQIHDPSIPSILKNGAISGIKTEESLLAISTLTNLRVLELTGLSIESAIPSEISRLTGLEVLNLENNSLYGTLPIFMNLLSNMKELYLTNNVLVGDIGTSLQFLSNLDILDLSDNRDLRVSNFASIPKNVKSLNLESAGFFNSPIRGEIGQLANLEVLNIAQTGITGSLPTEMGKLKKLKVLNLSSNYISGTLPWSKLVNLERLVKMDFSRNKLEGTALPQSISKLSNLISLNLHFNNLMGTIPSTLGDMSALSRLDFTHNFMSGHVPANLDKLSSLEYLGLSITSHLQPCTNHFDGDINYLCDIDGPRIMYSSECGDLRCRCANF